MAWGKVLFGALTFKGPRLVSGLFFPCDFMIGTCMWLRGQQQAWEQPCRERQLCFCRHPQSVNSPCFLLTRPMWGKLLTVLPVRLGAEKSKGMERQVGRISVEREAVWMNSLVWFPPTLPLPTPPGKERCLPIVLTPCECWQMSNPGCGPLPLLT